MLKLSVVTHTQEKGLDQYVERFLLHHSYIGIFLTGIIMPILMLAVVSLLCCVVLLPISLFMGWL